MDLLIGCLKAFPGKEGVDGEEYVHNGGGFATLMRTY